MVGITTSTIGSTAATRVGTGAKFTISNISASTDTLYLTDVQGEHFTNTSDISSILQIQQIYLQE